MNLLAQFPVSEVTFCMRRLLCKQLLDQYDMSGIMQLLAEQTLSQSVTNLSIDVIKVKGTPPKTMQLLLLLSLIQEEDSS